VRLPAMPGQVYSRIIAGAAPPRLGDRGLQWGSTRRAAATAQRRVAMGLFAARYLANAQGGEPSWGDSPRRQWMRAAARRVMSGRKGTRARRASRSGWRR